MSTIGTDPQRETSRGQDAVRILLIVAAAATELRDAPPGDAALSEAVAVLETQVRLQKLDFWVRNPDFLADELLNEYDRTGDLDCYRQATAIMQSDEPDVRRYPMLRFLFGAYEPLDEALAVLRSANLVIRRKRGTADRITRHDYYLTRSGLSTANRILHDAPEFRYFVERTQLVARLADGYGGTQLKSRQYEQDEYRNTVIGEHIESIAPRVHARLRGYADRLSQVNA
ncbi:hypothetical protein [Actinoplanes sp. TFC3]|uniref:hypothetical protein n=1 Tax=Actinoplanes sp. TFC3 TaxID=1710355 RepID=UPI001F3F23C3|nr:hypothetical protein [Actinoplanes sp. TFC3]